MERPCFDFNEIKLTRDQMEEVYWMAHGIKNMYEKHVDIRPDTCSDWIIEYVNKMIREIEKGEPNGKDRKRSSRSKKGSCR